ncbi:hypothetical protein SAMN02745174_02081 [Cetobacterium ceti]|uniref:Uncharacterized protein n=1 Tax=Cetobacterium ceti TaxID=180163 RepID=A0A1T4PWX5_9FUSO|nr:hypothetical protein [Cetobacterium ceti]SJZ95827.1 hypothetical protein SAMN02745174_02081 [Cetobacterium ceti]
MNKIIVIYIIYIILILILSISNVPYSQLVINIFTPIFILSSYFYKMKMEQKIKQDSDQYIYVTKLQYDMEFKIYSEISEKLFRLKVATFNLAPALDTLPSEEEERRKEYIDIQNFVKSIIFFQKWYLNMHLFMRRK